MNDFFRLMLALLFCFFTLSLEAQQLDRMAETWSKPAVRMHLLEMPQPPVPSFW